MTPSASTPLIPEIGVLAVPYHQFGSNWMTPHHVMMHLACYFQLVWLEPSHHWREASALWKRRAEISKLLPYLPSSFHVHLQELCLPHVYRSPRLSQFLSKVRIRRAWRQLDRLGCTTRVLYLWHHQFESALAVARQNISIYHIEDEYSFLANPQQLDPRELRVLRQVDQVFVHSPELLRRKGGINPNVAFVPNGVDYSLYSTPVAEPLDIASVPHPRIGYTGNLKTQLDWQLLHSLALRHRDWSFVFVGPRILTQETRSTMDAMSRLSNVYMLGAKTVRDLSAYPQHFDVCVMPYVNNGYTQNIYPLKLHEYLASGRPVVGSPIRSLRDFGKIIALATTVDEWTAALASALTPPVTSCEAATVRQRVARQHDWNELTYRIARTICERLGPEFTSRMTQMSIGTPNFP